LTWSTIMLDEKTKELIAVGATITANCQPCLEYHTAKAREAGASTEEILAAVETGRQVRSGSSAKMDRFAARHVAGRTVTEPASDCDCR
jgi:AhpD family alkylhydroperoxidase